MASNFRKQVERIKKVASARLNLSRKKGKGHPKAPSGWHLSPNVGRPDGDLGGGNSFFY